MKTTEIREKLYNYISKANDKKVKAIYTMLENEIQQEDEVWTDEFLNELNKRTSGYESGKLKTRSWKTVKKNARSLIKIKH